jgi:hypothetical protein
VLDYEGEEERFLRELAPFVEDRRLVLKIADDGSLDELRRRLMRRAAAPTRGDPPHRPRHGDRSRPYWPDAPAVRAASEVWCNFLLHDMNIAPYLAARPQ